MTAAAKAAAPAHLRLEHVVSGYGQIMAIKGISLRVETGGSWR
jgi:hypothetical protein